MVMLININVGLAMKNAKGFTLIELLIVVAIIAILTTLVTVNYKTSTISTQIGVMFKDGAAAKVAVTNDYYRMNTYTSSTYAANSKDFTTPNSEYITTISIVSGVITIQGDSNKFFGKNIWLTWTPSIVGNDLSWQCTVSTDAASYISSDVCS